MARIHSPDSRKMKSPYCWRRLCIENKMSVISMALKHDRVAALKWVTAMLEIGSHVGHHEYFTFWSARLQKTGTFSAMWHDLKPSSFSSSHSFMCICVFECLHMFMCGRGQRTTLGVVIPQVPYSPFSEKGSFTGQYPPVHLSLVLELHICYYA